jgi:hypothetical protein
MRNWVFAIVSAAAFLGLVQTADAAEGDKDSSAPPEKADAAAKPDADNDAKAKDAKDAKPDEAKAEKPKDDEKPKEEKSGDDEAGPLGGATGESQTGVTLNDLVNDGFVIRTTIFVPADAVTRQLGKVSSDAVVLTLQKSTSTAICYYAFKAYVDPGLTKIASCTVHR